MNSAGPGQRGDAGAKAATGRRPVLIAVVLVVVLAVGGIIAATRFLTGNEPGTTAAAARSSTAGSSARTAQDGHPVQPQALGRKAALPDAGRGRFNVWIRQVAGWLDIPPRAMRSYAKATVTLNKKQPDCHMSWVTLAGIGKHATNHGAEGGGIGADGLPAHPIGNVELRDFFDKVVSPASARGPMQLPEALWREYGAAADGHGAGDPQNLDDAALATGKALCAGGADLADGGAWWTAVSRVDDAPLFLHRVLATATVYGTVSEASGPPKPQPLHAVEYAISKIGLPYVWGGNGKGGADHGGFDCSGLTSAAYAAQGVDLRRMADWQYRDAPKVPKDQEPRLGDLVFFGDPATKIHHVGIYIGNRQMIDAPTFGEAVQVHEYKQPGDYAGAGRVVP